jgi:hypothetical protein
MAYLILSYIYPRLWANCGWTVDSSFQINYQEECYKLQLSNSIGGCRRLDCVWCACTQLLMATALEPSSRVCREETNVRNLTDCRLTRDEYEINDSSDMRAHKQKSSMYVQIKRCSAESLILKPSIDSLFLSLCNDTLVLQRKRLCDRQVARFLFQSPSVVFA